MCTSAVYYFAGFAVILMHTMIFPVKCQSTVGLRGGEHSDSSTNIAKEIQQMIAEAIRQQQNQPVHCIQENQEFLNSSVQRMRNQQTAFLNNLQTLDQRSQEQNIYNKQAQVNEGLLNASLQQMKNQHASVLRRLDMVIQLLLYHDISTKNETQNFWKLAIGGPLRPMMDIDLVDGFALLPTHNNWIIIMNRFDGSVNFNRDWSDYKTGFGDKGQGEFWLGNEIVHHLTNQNGLLYTLRIELYFKNTGGWYYAEYSTFSLDSEVNKYALRLSGFSGNVFDSLAMHSLPSDYNLGGMNFSTRDADNDKKPTGNCAAIYRAGWWFNDCQFTCLTCEYRIGFRWLVSYKSDGDGPLRAARMMIKRK